MFIGRKKKNILVMLNLQTAHHKVAKEKTPISKEMIQVWSDRNNGQKATSKIKLLPEFTSQFESWGSLKSVSRSLTPPHLLQLIMQHHFSVSELRMDLSEVKTFKTLMARKTNFVPSLSLTFLIPDIHVYCERCQELYMYHRLKKKHNPVCVISVGIISILIICVCIILSTLYGAEYTIWCWDNLGLHYMVMGYDILI